MKLLRSIKGKIQTQSSKLLQTIHGAFYKSHIIYFFTPLYAASVINRNDIVMYEASLQRKQMLLSGDIKSKTIYNLCDLFITPKDEIDHRLALKQKLLIREILPKKDQEDLNKDILKHTLQQKSKEERNF